METIGHRIRHARKLKRLTQQALADGLGISRVTVTQWETDVIKPSIGRLPMVAEILGCSEKWLLTGKGSNPDEADRPYGGPSTDIGQRLVLLRKACTGDGPNDAATFAAKSDIPYYEWETYEQGNPVPQEVVIKLSQYWGVTFLWIYRGDEDDLRGELRDRLLAVQALPHGETA